MKKLFKKNKRRLNRIIFGSSFQVEMALFFGFLILYLNIILTSLMQYLRSIQSVLETISPVVQVGGLNLSFNSISTSVNLQPNKYWLGLILKWVSMMFGMWKQKLILVDKSMISKIRCKSEETKKESQKCSQIMSEWGQMQESSTLCKENEPNMPSSTK